MRLRFSFFGLSCRLYRGSEVTLGSEDPFYLIIYLFFLRACLFKVCQVEHVLTMANLKLKPSRFTPRASSIYGAQNVHNQSPLYNVNVLFNRLSEKKVTPKNIWAIDYFPLNQVPPLHPSNHHVH